jgi:hypothetical protein
MLRAVVKNLYFLHNHNRPLAYLTAIYFSVLGKAVKKAGGGRSISSPVSAKIYFYQVLPQRSGLKRTFRRKKCFW